MDILKIFKAASSLSSIQRYSQTFLIKKENVLEHSGFVVLFCYLIGKQLQSEGVEINMGRLLSKAIIHDIDEIITGDVPRPTKYFNARSIIIFKEMEQTGTRLFLKDLIDDDSILESIYSDWEESKIGVAGGIVKLADLSAVVYKAWEEQSLLSNKNLAKHILGAIDAIEQFREPICLSGIKKSIIKTSKEIVILWR